MNYNEETKKRIKKLIHLSMNKEVDDEYIHSFIKIINDDLIFSERVKLNKNDRKDMMKTNTDMKNLDIAYNIELMKQHFSKSYSKIDKQFVPSVTLFYSYWISFVLLHELTHLYQKLCARDSISEYLEVNKLYKIIYDSFSHFGKLDLLKYGIFHDTYCLERNANITSANFLVETFEDTELDAYSKASYMNQLLGNGYYLKKGKIISPVERTFKYLKVKEKIETDSLPFETLFTHGFNIANIDFHFLYDEILSSGGIVNYEETMNKMKILSRSEV